MNMFKTKKKILMVHNFYLIGGGEHTVFKNEVELLIEHGHEVIEYTRSNEEIKNSKIKLLFLPLTTIWSIKTYFEVRKIIKKNNIDIVHCHNTFPLISPSVYYAAKSLNIPVVQTIHNFRLLCPAGIFYRDNKICELCLKKNSFKPALKYSCYRKSKVQTFIVIAMLKIHRKLRTYDKINYIFLTEFNKRKFSKLLNTNNSNIFIKPNFVKDNFNSIITKERKKVFVFAGRLEENKGLKHLLETWRNIDSNYFLHIYGSGSLEQYVLECEKLQKNVKFFGFSSHEDIFKDLQNATALIFPSLLYEGYPMIITESFSIKCPVISTNIGNSKDIIEESNGGVIFDFNIENSLKRAVDMCIDNYEELSLNAYNYYKEVLSKRKNYDNLSIIYDNLQK